MFILALVQQNSQLLRKSTLFCIGKQPKVSRDRLALEMGDLPSNLWVTEKRREVFLWGFFAFGVMWQKQLLCISVYVLTIVWINLLILTFECGVYPRAH